MCITQLQLLRVQSVVTYAKSCICLGTSFVKQTDQPRNVPVCALMWKVNKCPSPRAHSRYETPSNCANNTLLGITCSTTSIWLDFPVTYTLSYAQSYSAKEVNISVSSSCCYAAVGAIHWHNLQAECWYFWCTFGVPKQSFVCQESLPSLLCKSYLDVMHVHVVVLTWHAIRWCKQKSEQYLS